MNATMTDTRALEAEMAACEQTAGVSVLDHGHMVADRYRALVAHLRGGELQGEGWRLPEWIADTRVLAGQPDIDTMLRYLVFHDCGKPRCLAVDAEGKRHFPDHAEVSARTWLEIGGDPEVAELIRLDMAIHTIKDADVAAFAERPQAMALVLAGLSEIHANAAMFGGIESTSFKIKYKQIDKRGKAVLVSLGRKEA